VSGRTLVLVRFRTSGTLSAAQRRALLERTSPAYRGVTGLRRKHFIAAPGEGGGLYEFESREIARAYFEPGWFARMQAQYGVVPSVEFFDDPCVVDNVAGTVEFDDDDSPPGPGS
jgi:hypothetical protein